MPQAIMQVLTRDDAAQRRQNLLRELHESHDLSETLARALASHYDLDQAAQALLDELDDLGYLLGTDNTGK